MVTAGNLFADYFKLLDYSIEYIELMIICQSISFDHLLNRLIHELSG